MSPRQARVHLDGEPVGTLTEQQDGYTFQYADHWVSRPEAPPISLTLPVRGEPYWSRHLHPFFENLLPEGWLLELSTARLKIPKDDAFGLLLATCADCIGAVEILPAGEDVQVDDDVGEARRPLPSDGAE